MARDFVELPSQLYEHWLEEPQVRWSVSPAISQQRRSRWPRALLEKLLAARNFNPEALPPSNSWLRPFVDMDLRELEVGHSLEDAAPGDPDALQAASLARIGMPEEIAMRHAAPQFGHVFSGDGYGAGYYSYLWSEVLDAERISNAFHPDRFHCLAAQRLRRYLCGGRDSTTIAPKPIAPFAAAIPRSRRCAEGRGLGDDMMRKTDDGPGDLARALLAAPPPAASSRDHRPGRPAGGGDRAYDEKADADTRGGRRLRARQKSHKLVLLDPGGQLVLNAAFRPM